MSLFEWTGNPFVDNGIGALLAHTEKEKPESLTIEDVKAVSELMLRVYLTPAWLKSMQNIFPGGAFTNPAFAARRRKVVKSLIHFLIGRIQQLEQGGNCTFCGRRNALRLTKQEKTDLPLDIVPHKTYIPLNGSGAFKNFFPSGINGADVCPNCIYAIQCAPLNFYTSNYDEKRFVVLHSNSFNVLEEWSREAKREIDQQEASGNFTGCFNEGYNNATNAFFHVIEKILNNHDFGDYDRYTAVRLYHFDNYNQPKAQPLKIYDMRAPVFYFLARVKQSPFYSDWRKLLRRNYYFVKSGRAISLETMEDQEEERKSQKNFVLEKLLRDQPVIRHFYHRTRREVYAPWGLLEIYLQEVLQMSNERIATIKKVADELAAMIKEQDNLKRLRELSYARNYGAFRNVLIRCTRDRVAAKAEEPLFTFDEYVEHLFPEGYQYWNETRDLILFRIYETLHTWLKDKDVKDLPDPRENEEDSVSDASENLDSDFKENE
ncbi:MAG: type I-B CRISPR-associated protein Cas8b1/Cst1 [Abitibacteriaceae bacterium]|nr:type I-B CRISPR-associated protein Cas8b1/Cst1 [Abditibacteriaceae bacterium]